MTQLRSWEEMSKGQYQLIKDPEYGYLRVEPLPSEEEVRNYYLEEFYTGEYKRFNDSSLEVQQEEKDFFDSRWAGVLNRIEQLKGPVQQQSVFDIGCGYGQALLYFKAQGLSVAGLEPSQEGSDYVREQGIPVFQGNIDALPDDLQQRYDIVTMFNSLEHLREPAKTLKHIRSELLTQNGVLVLDVPNEFNDFQLIADQEYGLDQWWICPPNHINYFNPESLQALLEACGYQVLHMEASFPLELFMLFGEVYVGDGALGKACHQKRVRFESLMRKYGRQDKLDRLYAALADLQLGRQVVVYATPAASR